MNKFVKGQRVYHKYKSRWCTVTTVLKYITLEGLCEDWEDELIPLGEGFYRLPEWDEGSRVKAVGERFYYLLDGETDRICGPQPESYLSAEAPAREVVYESGDTRWVRVGDFNYLEGVSS